MKTIAILAFWSVDFYKGNFYCPYSHYIYLKFLSTKLKKIYLIAPTHNIDYMPKQKELITFGNIEIIKMPYAQSYISALKHYFKYKKNIQNIENKIDYFYCRVPDPFSWMPSLYTNKQTIMHYVGDIIETTQNNINISKLKKIILLSGFAIENKKIISASKKSTVYTNGYHIAEKLKSKGINATPVVSSTVFESDIQKYREQKNTETFRIIYVGYLRYSKGIDTIISVINELNAKKIDFHFDIIGDGEMKSTLESFVTKKHYSKQVSIHGHIDDREKLYSLIRAANLFFFPSLSEGSPRVIIESMSQGIPVLSTPVGSLPASFKHMQDIFFFPFKDYNKAVDLIITLSKQPSTLEQVSKNAINKIKEKYTIDKFLTTVFELKD